MRRASQFALIACAIAATACGDRPTQPSERPGPAFGPVANLAPCISGDSVEALIRALFPAGQDRNAMLSRFRQVQRLVGDKKPGPDTASAQSHALTMVDFALKKYRDGRLTGGTSTATANALAGLLSGILCTAGLPPFDPAALGLDGAAVVVSPADPTTTVVTGTRWAGIEVTTGAVTQPTLITIRRLPDFPSPLLTAFDQYPLYYEFEYNPGTTFTTPQLVGVCISDLATPPDPSRLRLAHNIAPFTPGSVEILDAVPAPFLDCTNAGLASAGGRWGFDLARGGVLVKSMLASALLPTPAHAAVVFGAGVGGTVRNFSPFGLVDTLGYMTFASIEEEHARAGQPVTQPPAVMLRTPTGQPMAGVPVNFVVTLGGGSLTGGAAVTGANGIAATSSWTLGFQQRNEVRATAVTPVGTGISGSPKTFLAFLIP